MRRRRWRLAVAGVRRAVRVRVRRASEERGRGPGQALDPSHVEADRMGQMGHNQPNSVKIHLSSFFVMYFSLLGKTFKRNLS
jgi:hypothetical protein